MGCRTRDPKPQLVRIVRDSAGVVAVDPSGRAAGRGAYVHPDERCLARAGRPGVLGRALRTSLDAAEAARLLKELRMMAGEPR